MKKVVALLLVLALSFSFTACSESTVDYTDSASTAQAANITTVGYDSDDLDTSWDSSELTYIVLEGDEITLSGDGAVVDGNQIAITSAGTYIISGTLDDGQIIVNTKDEETVRLILNGVDITCSTSSPIYVKNAEKTVITLADGTENFVTDGDSYIIEDSLIEDSESIEPNAAIFSKDDLTINGGGSLTVNANYYNGIQSKDDLKITGGTITVNAVNDAIKGRDSVIIRDAAITVNAGADGIQSNNDSDEEKGFIFIESGTLNITAGRDGIQAETSLTITGGDITIFTADGSASVSHTTTGDMTGGRPDNWDWDNTTTDTSDDGSYKGLKAGGELTITGGTITIDSADDALHSNGSLTIDGGTLVLASGDDGLHADSALEINGGNISISQCYEGLESAVITINDGSVYIVSSDDGINVVGAGDETFVGGRPIEGDTGVLSNNWLYINGGYTYIDAGGDGLDVNGSIEMTDGVVIVNGPTDSMNGAIDYYTTFTISGGLLVAAGSSGMAMSPTNTSSSQYSVMITFSSQQTAGTMVHIESEDGQEILTFAPTKAYQTVLLCSPELESCSSYSVYLGGSSTGTVTDGLYSGGSYSGGSQYTSFSVAGFVTIIGSSGGGFTDGGGFPGGGGGGRPSQR